MKQRKQDEVQIPAPSCEPKSPLTDYPTVLKKAHSGTVELPEFRDSLKVATTRH